MNRTELAALVNPKAPDINEAFVIVPTREDHPLLRATLESYFASPDGLRDLADAPRANGRQMTAAEAVNVLIEETKGL